MEIPVEILEKYHVSTNHLEDEEGTYRTFLSVTDYAMIKTFEELLSEPLSFVTNLVKACADNREIMKYRAIARKNLMNK